MIDPRDLPFDIGDTPDLYTTFRKVRVGADVFIILYETAEDERSLLAC